MEKKSDNYGKHYFCRDFEEAKSSDETDKSSKTLALQGAVKGFVTKTKMLSFVSKISYLHAYL